MTQINFTVNFEELTQELLNCNLNQIVKSQLITILNAYMEAERDELVNVDAKAKTGNRQAVRNGYYERDFTIPIGRLNLKIPRTREGEFSTKLFERYERMDQSLILMMIDSVVNGVSTRKVTKIVEAMGGEKVSKSFVSNAMKRLDPEIQEWSQRPLTHTNYQYLYVDAMYIKVRENHKVVPKAVYIAQGVTENGYRELIGFKISEEESHKAWSAFFSDLRNRGFSNPNLVISDAHAGLKSAIQSQFLNVPWQRCTFHFLQNMIKVMPKKNSEAERRVLRQLFQASTIQHAREFRDEFFQLVSGRSKFDRAAEILEQGFDDATQYFQFPQGHYKFIKSTNTLENINMQIRRREKVIRIFPNVDSAFRLIGSVLIDLSEKLEETKRYLP
ncbi:IS256 family transposase [Abyssicoccus albus]|uniref:IS256 family transposase n=1 Tax=Abyssicoccus albus TaxID=1817405 RepID=UPI00097E1F36|nr:IS256 family transposase [Abyssicoccus albus]AQL55576.1 IS256 family transposase [Abyssicoccus albus]AQL55912.1 IS256 family transposase [Abyssicoccus albus]